MFTRTNPANDPLLRRAAAASAKAARAIQAFNNRAAQARTRGLEYGRQINAAQGPRLSNAKVAELVEAERKGLNNLLKNRAENRKNFENSRRVHKGPTSAGQERRSNLFQYYYPLYLEEERRGINLNPENKNYYRKKEEIVRRALASATKRAEEQEYKEAWDAHAQRRAFLEKQRGTRKNINKALKNRSEMNRLKNLNAKLNEELATMNLNSLPNSVH